MRQEALDWLAVAESDLQHASESARLGHHDWACFSANQAAEKALKAMIIGLKRRSPPNHHDLTSLCKELGELMTVVPEERLAGLSLYYVTARYPNPGIRLPFRSFTGVQSQTAIETARGIVDQAYRLLTSWAPTDVDSVILRSPDGIGATKNLQGCEKPQRRFFAPLRMTLKGKSIADVTDHLPQQIVEAIKTFRATVKQEYPDARLYLYGSFARGDWLYESDIDMVVVSGRFSGELVERMAQVRRLAPDGVPWEILTYTPEEMEYKLQNSLTWEDIASYWIEVTDLAEDQSNN